MHAVVAIFVKLHADAARPGRLMIAAVNPMWMPHMVIVACCVNMDTVWHAVAEASVVACPSNFVPASLSVTHAVVAFSHKLHACAARPGGLLVTSVNRMWIPHMVIVTCCCSMDTVKAY